MIKAIIILYFVISCYGYQNYFRANWECADDCEMISCEDGFADCNDHPIDGCEVNTNIEIKNCGHCDVECPAIANGVPTCISGKCGIGWCNVGFADCNYNPSDGCEIDLQTHSTNCGHCGNICTHNEKCMNGACHNVTGVTTTSCGTGQFLCGTTCCSGTCSGIGTSAVCSTTTEYKNYGCVCLQTTSPPCSLATLFNGTLFHSLIINGPFTSDVCFNVCNTATLFTMEVDTSSYAGINNLCQCFMGTSGNPTIVSGCSGGVGYTTDGMGIVELYVINPPPNSLKVK
jgi:hypothetical protein